MCTWKKSLNIIMGISFLAIGLSLCSACGSDSDTAQTQAYYNPPIQITDPDIEKERGKATTNELSPRDFDEYLQKNYPGQYAIMSPKRVLSASTGLTGTWEGRAGMTGSGMTLDLTDNHGSLSGSWTSDEGDTRDCVGSRSGRIITLKDPLPDGDTWHLSLSTDSTRLSGTGFTVAGNSYPVDLIH